MKILNKEKKSKEKIEKILNNPLVDRVISDLGKEVTRTYGAVKHIEDYFTRPDIREAYANVESMSQLGMLLVFDRDNYLHIANQEDTPRIVARENQLLAQEVYNIVSHILEYYGRINLDESLEQCRQQQQRIRGAEEKEDEIAKRSLESVVSSYKGVHRK